MPSVAQQFSDDRQAVPNPLARAFMAQTEPDGVRAVGRIGGERGTDKKFDPAVPSRHSEQVGMPVRWQSELEMKPVGVGAEEPTGN